MEIVHIFNSCSVAWGNRKKVPDCTLGSPHVVLYLQCDPNMSVYGVWINNLDTRLPRIALFANRDIRNGEEITFDYKMTGEKRANSLSFCNFKVCSAVWKSEYTWCYLQSTSNCIMLMLPVKSFLFSPYITLPVHKYCNYRSKTQYLIVCLIVIKKTIIASNQINSWTTWLEFCFIVLPIVSETIVAYITCDGHVIFSICYIYT